ncbi:MAG: hypothetical protein GF411_19945 [Candidatus Lokiarchaeota archaeon]|nr:hypothetical protein [Candidatus Lokiarchaeota archaeon]
MVNTAEKIDKVEAEPIGEMSDDEFQQVLIELDAIIEDIVDKMLSMATYLGRMSKPQIKEVCQRYKGTISADHIKRIALFGRGMIKEYMARPEKYIYATELQRYSDKARQDVADPERVVEVLTIHGRKSEVSNKKLCELTPVQMINVVDPIYGIRTVKQQEKVFVSNIKKACKRQKRTPSDEEIKSFLYASAEPSEDGKFIVIRGHEGDCVPVMKIEIPASTIKDILSSIT